MWSGLTIWYPNPTGIPCTKNNKNKGITITHRGGGARGSLESLSNFRGTAAFSSLIPIIEYTLKQRESSHIKILRKKY